METEQLKHVALSEKHTTLGAKMVPFAGYLMPVRYSSDIEEHNCVREKVGVFDVSHMGEFIVEGAQALDLIQYVTSNDAAKLTPGKVQYSCLPNNKGGIVDDLLVYMLADNKYLLVVNASNIEKDWDWISSHNQFDATMTNVSDDYSLLAVQGPKAVSVLQKLTAVQLDEIPYYAFTIGEFAGVAEVILSNTGYTGAGGFEVYVKNDDAEKIWDALFEAGEPEGILPIGLGARDTLRLEKGYCLYGNDINDETSPIEAGLSWITKFTKEFINKEYIQAQKDNGVKQKLVGFKLKDKGIPRHGYSLLDAEGAAIGEVTSGSMSPVLGLGIGMGYVKTDSAKIGTIIGVQVRKRILEAEIVKMPFV